MPASAFSPVGSMQGNFGPKSQKTELVRRMDKGSIKTGRHLPEKTSHVSRNKSYLVRVRKVVDFNLPL